MYLVALSFYTDMVSVRHWNWRNLVLLGRILWLDFFDLSNYLSVMENILQLSQALFLLLHLYTKHRPSIGFLAMLLQNCLCRSHRRNRDIWISLVFSWKLQVYLFQHMWIVIYMYFLSNDYNNCSFRRWLFQQPFTVITW